MSQIPPPPPYQPQQPNFAPPGGFQPPPPGGPGQYAMQPSGTNGWGLASLITGLVSFCIPFLGGLVAVVLGIVGLSAAKKNRSGKGLAIAGLILGLLSIAAYALFGSVIWGLVQGTKVNRDIAKQFLTDLNAGNVAAAAAATDGSIPDAEIQSGSDALKAGGAISDITTISVKDPNAAPGQTSVTTAGAVTFSNGTNKAFEMVQQKVDDQWKIVSFAIK